MSIGATIRRAFGPYERQISELWRAMFINIDEWTQICQSWAPDARRILEIGCGEGYSTDRLVALWPEAQIDAIDIADNIGRLYAGPPGRVNFRIAFAEELAQEQPGAYDLIILSDVLHHVPLAARESLLRSARALLAPGGTLAFKDWHRNRAPVYYAAWAADRWLTGDRIAYLTRDEASVLIASVFGEGRIVDECWVRPWRNNYGFRVVAR
ncbi:MAG: class I SAM-dependent methyltransferase [Pseudomonadota bacterium]|nr:class I SAM-dependent methyltransferase [Pseudomonadota bacterium]